MVMWRVRDFHADDLDAAIRLWDDPAASEAPVFGLSDLIAAIGQTRRTLTPELVTEFEQDIRDYARV